MTLAGLRIGVIFGSRSPEHEISVITACQVMPVLTELGAEVVPLYVTKSGRWRTDPAFAQLASFRGALPEEAGAEVVADLGSGRLRLLGGGLLGRSRELPVDLLFPLVHGSHGEDGTLAGLADVLRLPQVGSGLLGGALAMDKHRSKLLLGAAGLPVVGGQRVASLEEAAALEVGYPLVVKPNRSGSSIGVTLVPGPGDLNAAVELALRFDREAILEPAVPGAEDLNCAVKRRPERASEVERPRKEAGFLSYRDKYAPSGELLPKGGGKGKGDPRRELPAQIPSPLRARIQELAVRAFDALDCGGTARVDFLLSDGGELYVNEVNTVPGSLAFYLWEASGLGFAELLTDLVGEALERGVGLDPALPGNLLAGGQLLGK